MAISQKMQDAINAQINYELHSAYIYASMAAAMTTQNLAGAAHWLRQQAHEEMFHAMKFHDYLLDRDGVVKLTTIEGPPTEWASALAVFSHALEHERKVTARLNNLLELAIEEKDHASQNLLRWFIDEQVEEEATFNEIIHKLKLVGNNGAGLYMIDREMIGRAAPTLPGAPAA